MKPRSAALVVLATAGVLFGGLLAVIIVGRVFQAVHRQLTAETARQQFVAQWRPPADLSPAAVLPQNAGGRVLVPEETREKLTDPALGLVTTRGLYTVGGKPDIEVFVCRATAAEAGAVFQRTRGVFSDRGGTTSALEHNGRLRLSSSEPRETVELWFLQDHLFFFRAKGELEAPFIRTYLSAIRGN